MAVAIREDGVGRASSCPSVRSEYSRPQVHAATIPVPSSHRTETICPNAPPTADQPTPSTMAATFAPASEPSAVPRAASSAAPTEKNAAMAAIAPNAVRVTGDLRTLSSSTVHAGLMSVPRASERESAEQFLGDVDLVRPSGHREQLDLKVGRRGSREPTTRPRWRPVIRSAMRASASRWWLETRMA